ncbi:acetyl/propionyl/methylcrotonyl-CoA carboxylase subunit alpha [Robiginitomaculum antarcticum]|uniref:acetyl/propionyl/methylcrotonyl-CoA carboxylase subunit alpha n=1 Tax=Robiginitomaculum antarcticum TaxID=437507 RepID=UPI00037781AE|nr:acetyl-CoA carboxylase biotin carboxylase subunit [Robiginitomaculum antarcticum]
MSKLIKTLLVANRGEIACRVIRTAREMGIKSVAVYSDADVNAPHVKMADMAAHIGGSPVGESYLRIDKIIAAAKEFGADAIHPGYGFLSENAAFSAACDEAGIIFVGPPVKAIDIMGDKAKSKRAMIAAGVPCVPGYQGEDQSDAVLIKEAKKIGMPVMVKAAAGGGGRGMRLVHKESEIENAIKLARSEAKNAFGNDQLIVEKAIMEPRHVEIQVFADQSGHTIHLGERDCSVQRRHQKVLEEAPCPVMTPKLRAAMGRAAIEAAKAVDYVGAGTVEFLLAKNGEFYFLEMNTRLQVEHPVTELVTGYDLVKLQIMAAQGEPLGISQDDVKLTGHAIEARLYAEDPADDFLPSTGPVHLFTTPSGDGIRVDSGIETGGAVSPFYDSMVAKIIGYGATREEARARLITALSQTALVGVKHNRDFLLDALDQPVFAKGEATTAFVGQTYGESGFEAPAPRAQELALAAALQFTLGQQRSMSRAVSPMAELLGWHSAQPVPTPFVYGETLVEVIARGKVLTASVGEEIFTLNPLYVADNQAVFEHNGTKIGLTYFAASETHIHITSQTQSFALINLAGGSAGDEAKAGDGSIEAPMHGLLLEIKVSSGDEVKIGDTLAVLEAMKMQHEILADIDGVVDEIYGSAGSQIAADDLILVIKPVED